MSKRLCMVFVAFLFLSGMTTTQSNNYTLGEDCPNLKIIFARGSGEVWQENDNFIAFKNALQSKLDTISLNYEILDLNYPAIGVGLDHPLISLGAFFGGGESYKFGDSVNAGVEMLENLIRTSCPETKFVLGGYSQGAIVISKALPAINPERLIYAATFGDPKLYLPEGAGLLPDACKNQNLSPYRIYVPDCHAHEGLLGGYKPYVPNNLIGKVGAWCNKSDIMCSSGLSMDDHTHYIADALYEDAAKLLFDKITSYFSLPNNFIAPHDTAILIDSTGSMRPMIASYKAEALRLAAETLASGGRVALYDYRDLNDPYIARQHCDFETCTLDTFKQALQQISTKNGGDAPESLLSSSLKVMQELDWQYGATKSLIVLTDTGYHSPDRDGTTLDMVITLSRAIDPVNFYIITTYILV